MPPPNSFNERIVEIIKNGGVGVLPSDTIYGLSCRALDEKAVQRIYSLKDRSSNKPLIILISDFNMLDLLSIKKEQTKLVKKYWPGPLSAIFDAPKAPAWLTRGSGTLAVRWPDNTQLCGLIDNTGPLISTSANLEGQPTARSVEEAKHYFGDRVDFYVDGGKLKGQPSTVVRINNGQLEIIRQGAVKI